MLLWSLTVLLMVVVVESRDREYYLAAEEVEWDYAPGGGRNVVDDRQDVADIFLKGGTNRIGRVYTKCVYKAYTNLNFNQEIGKPAWMGLLGPILRAETGDKMIVNFLNRCSRDFSVHPHGVMYEKQHEGALYLDRTSGSKKSDDAVPPGGSYKYIWEIPESFGPTVDDPTCISWAYHSHVNPERDVNSGLIGIMLTCKKGALTDDNNRRDGQKDYSMLFKIFNEELSWYYEKNLEKCGDPATCKTLDKENNSGFDKSNRLHAVNGVVFGNLPQFEACQNDLVTWHMVGMGSSTDLHTIQFHGQTMLYNKHRTGSVDLYAAEFKTVVMITQEPGKWLINCQVSDHYTDGMQAYLDVKQCGDVGPRVSTKYRVYYIAAEEVMWDYAPSGEDQFNGGQLTDPTKDSSKYYTKGADRIGGRYKKALYLEYTDGSFTVRKDRTTEERHLGFLGPEVRAEVGETIIVVFRNKASRSFSIQAQGVAVNKQEEGSKYNDNTEGVESIDNEVAPGGLFIYFWYFPEASSPSPTDPDCVTYFYQSGVNPVRDMNSGLVGPLLVCKRDSLTEESKQRSVDSEFILALSTTDENLSWYIEDNINIYTEDPSSVDKTNSGFIESNKMRNLNGRSYGNLEGLDMSLNTKVTWHIFGLGSSRDLNTVYFHGNTLTKDDSRVDTITFLPGITATALMEPATPGVWGLVSRVNSNFIGGLTALYRVHQGNAIHQSPSSQTGKTRIYNIAAVEREWDFVPKRRSLVDGKSLYDDPVDVFVRNDTVFIGSVYKKALYREFEDHSFTVEKSRDEENIHLGMLGPLIHAEVGDTINIVFKNLASRPYSIHPHGIIVDKGNEGALYKSGDAYFSDDSVASGSTFIYKWRVSEKAGPGTGDPNCIVWPYYSHVNPVKDVYSGLVGPLVICRKGTLDVNNKRTDNVNKERVLFFSTTSENDSWYLNDNIKKYAPDQANSKDRRIRGSNRMHAINGRMYGNNEGLDIDKGDTLAWYIIGMGSTFDIHTVHFHGQTLLHKQQVTNRVDVIEIFPGVSETLEMLADNPGTWLLHCHVASHLRFGMETLFTIRNVPNQIPTVPKRPNQPSNPSIPINQPNNFPPSNPSPPRNPSVPSNPSPPSNPSIPSNPSPSNPPIPSNPSPPINLSKPSPPSNPSRPGRPSNPLRPSNPSRPGNQSKSPRSRFVPPIRASPSPPCWHAAGWENIRKQNPQRALRLWKSSCSRRGGRRILPVFANPNCLPNGICRQKAPVHTDHRFVSNTSG